MSEDFVTRTCDRIAKALTVAGVRERMWSCGVLKDDRYCIVHEGGAWKIGHFERGRFDIREVVTDEDRAVAVFVEWVTSMEKVALRNVESTKAWMREHGLKRP